MKVGKSVWKCIDEWTAGDNESAMLHACNAVDGTAKKVYRNLGNRARFTRFIRDNYPIFGPMALPGINVDQTRWPVPIQRPTATGGAPDVADVIYSIHRCTHGHGDELPDGFELLENAAGEPEQTTLGVAEGKVMLSDRTHFGLLAICVASPANTDQITKKGYFLTFGRTERMVINDWWGRYEDFLQVIHTVELPQVVLNFGDWMQ